MPLVTHRCRPLPVFTHACEFCIDTDFPLASSRSTPDTKAQRPPPSPCKHCPFGPQPLAARLSQVVREKEQAVQELREYEEEVEKLQAQRDNLHDLCSQLKGEKETMLRTVSVLQPEPFWV